MRTFTVQEINDIWNRLRSEECCDEATVPEFFDEIARLGEDQTGLIKPTEINVAAEAMREIATKIERGEIDNIEIRLADTNPDVYVKFRIRTL